MTNIDSVTNSVTSASANQSAAPSADSASAISSDFTTFLQMLTAQLQNQDPLNPIESADFAVQLATFSNVEQQVRTNDLLTTLVDRTRSEDMSTMANWVGQEVRVQAPAAYEGTPISISPNVPSTAASAELVVRTDSGQEINRIAFPSDTTALEWNGLDADAEEAPWGTYNFEIESFDADGTVIDTRTPQIYARVNEAQLTDSGVELVVGGGTTIPVSNVTAIRDPA